MHARYSSEMLGCKVVLVGGKLSWLHASIPKVYFSFTRVLDTYPNSMGSLFGSSVWPLHVTCYLTSKSTVVSFISALGIRSRLLTR